MAGNLASVGSALARVKGVFHGSGVCFGKLVWRLDYRKGVWRHKFAVLLLPYSIVYFWLTRNQLGVKAHLGRPVFQSLRVRLSEEFNSHFLVAGMSGAGKSSFCKNLVSELSSKNCNACVLDVNGEYNDCVASFGGRVYPAGAVGISVLDLSGCSPRERVTEISGTLRRVLALGDVQAIWLSRAMLKAFADKGFVEDKPATWNRAVPSMSDVLVACDELLKGRRDESLAGLQRRLESLSATRIFGSKTVLPLSDVVGGVVSFDLSGLRSRDVQALFVEFFLRRLNAFLESRKGSESVFVFLDEAQALCRSIGSEPSFVGEVMRMGRKFGFSLVVSSQSLEGLDQSIIANAGVPVMFSQRAPKDVEVASRLLSGRGFSEKSGFVEHELSVLGRFEFLSRIRCGRELVKCSFFPKSFPKTTGFSFDSHNQRLALRFFREFLPGEEIRYCDKSVLGGLELDFVFPNRKVAVEWNGSYFHSMEKQAARDARKKELLEKMGWRLLIVEDEHLSEEDVGEKVRGIVGAL